MKPLAWALMIVFGSVPTVEQLAEALVAPVNRHAWLEEDLQRVRGKLRLLVEDGKVEFRSGEAFVEWDLRELEVPPVGEFRHYRHRLLPSGLTRPVSEIGS